MRFKNIPFLSSVSTGLEEELQNEELAESARRDRFQERFPGIASVPVVNRAFRAVYCHGFSYVLVLLIAITVFTAIKVPYLKAPFTGEHSMKYSTYVEPAFYMSQKNTMLWYQKKYVSDPVHNPEGIFNKFGHLPLMEWGLFLTYKIFPDTAMETKTRIFTHSIGVLVLLYAYLFFCGYFPKSYNVLFIWLLALNPVFSFSSYVTVLDIIALLFMFMSLRQISVYFYRKDISSLIWAAVWFGLGNAVKYPLFLWLAPISLLFMYYESENQASFIKSYFIYIVITLFVTFTAVYICNRLIISPKPAFLLTFLATILLVLISYYIKRKEGFVQDIFEKIYGNKKIFFMALGVSIIIVILAIRLFGLYDFADEFLTDSSLIANYRLYKYMLLTQFKNYMTRNLFWFGLFGIAMAFLARETAMRKVAIPFVFGSTVYWIIASKSIFIHIYYSLIIMITLTIGAAYVIHLILRNFKELTQKTVMFACLLSIILPPVIDATNGRMMNYLNVEKVVKFIDENTKPDEFILFQGFLTPISIYTGRGFVMPAVLIDNQVMEDINTIGFANTMHKYKIKYFFTPNESPFYLDFAPMFAHTKIREPSGQNYDRNILINNAIGVQSAEISRNLKDVEEIERKYNIPEKFVLAAQFGRFKFYSFQN